MKRLVYLCRAKGASCYLDNNQNDNDMTEQEMIKRLSERATELLAIPEVNAIFQAKPTQKDAEDWIFAQALITLMYSPKEREEIANRKKQQLTETMNKLEETITRQQQYILQHGEANDAGTDTQWEQYKVDAEYNLQKWDTLKAQRDAL